jgi:hypothetical protein
MEEMKKIYEQMVSNNQTHIDKLQKWLRDELVDEPFAKIAKIEQEKTYVEKQVANLVQQLNDKNTELIFFQEKVKQLEERVPAEVREKFVEEPKMDSKYQSAPDEPQDMQQKEWLEMIKELAQQHEMREDEKDDTESKPEEQQKNWGSKVAKKFGLF